MITGNIYQIPFLCIMEVDYLVLGQGIAGTLLSNELLNAGASVIVIDDGDPCSSSLTCGGIINPVTGKRLVTSWMIDQLLPFAGTVYKKWETKLGVPLIKNCDVLDFHASQESQAGFESKIEPDNAYLYKIADETHWRQYFRFNYGIGGISRCLIIDTIALINGWKTKLIENGLLLRAKFDWTDLKIAGGGVEYKDLPAKKIICCEGAVAENNPFFKMLPWSKDKGEALIVAIPGLPEDFIFKQGIGIVPKGNGLFWVGATHDWKYTDLQPTKAFRDKTIEQLDYWLRLPYTILDHVVARRPANFDRKPFVGLHPVHPEIAILNGMGGKGCSFAPFFASQLARNLISGAPILPDANVSRFSKMLLRNSV
jgi:glycine/D-amino acid oxidase-like deaminating enzyme